MTALGGIVTYAGIVSELEQLRETSIDFYGALRSSLQAAPTSADQKPVRWGHTVTLNRHDRTRTLGAVPDANEL